MKKIILFATMIGFAAMTVSASDGKAIWDKSCAKCHGTDGSGQTNIGKRLGCKDYSDAKVQAELTDAAAVKAIKEGFKDKDGKAVMRPAENLSDEDINTLVAYMRTLKK